MLLFCSHLPNPLLPKPQVGRLALMYPKNRRRKRPTSNSSPPFSSSISAKMEEDRPKQSTPFSKSCPWTGPTISSNLCDSLEIKASNRNLDRAVDQQRQSVGPAAEHLPIQARRSSPLNCGSSLYDSYELKAVTQQLSRALQAQERASPYLGYLSSPLHAYRRWCTEHLYKESGKTPKRVGCGRVIRRGGERKGGEKGSGGIVPRLWRKIKRTFLWRREG